MDKLFSLKTTLLVLLIGLGIGAGYMVLATSEDDIVYPVAELGGCVNESACRAYCEGLDHIDACLDFAEKHNLLSDEEIDRAREFVDIGGRGPGACTSQDACEAYCEDVSHIEECLAFAEKHGFITDEELQEARRVAKALQEGAQLPGGCRSKDACEAYCEDPSHMRECLAFAESAGFIPPDELAEAKQVLAALESGARLPGGCRGKEACEAYCEDPSHITECFEFAVAAGFIPPEEVEHARKIMPLMAAGEMPGGCRSKEQCEAYCSQEGNMEECITFFEKAGVISAEELEMFRKTGGKGPGGCQGREQCESFCNDPANQEACFAFAKEHGLIPEEELEHMQEGLTRFHEGFQQAPPEVAQCLKEKVGEEVLAEIEAGTFMPNPQLGEQMRTCFVEFMPPGLPGGFAPGQEGGFSGPGGCASEEECRAYCSDPAHSEECAQSFGGTRYEGELQGLPPEGFPVEGGSFGAPLGGQECMERMIASLQGPPPPDFEQRVREECYGSFVPPPEVIQQPETQTETNFAGAVINAARPILRFLLPFLFD